MRRDIFDKERIPPEIVRVHSEPRPLVGREAGPGRRLPVFFVGKGGGRALIVTARHMTKGSAGAMRKGKRKDLTLADAGEFFDAHDLSESGGAVDVADLKVRVPKRKHVGVELPLFRKIQAAARRKP